MAKHSSRRNHADGRHVGDPNETDITIIPAKNGKAFQVIGTGSYDTTPLFLVYANQMTMNKVQRRPIPGHRAHRG